MSEMNPQEGEAQVTPYQQLGGETRVRALVDRFYALLENEPRYAIVRRLYPADLTNARNKLYWYLSGWLGGPNLYIERFGHPMLRARHLPFSIGIAERDAWLACMGQALRDTGAPEALREPLEAAFSKTADWMRNRPE